MAHWYQPKEKLKEIRERRHGGKREDCFDNWPFYDYVVDEFYTRALFDLLIVPQEHKLVKLNLGRVGALIRVDEQGHIIPQEDKTTKAVKEYRDWPYGGVFEPGFHFAFTPLGLSKLAVVFTGQRQEPIQSRNLITKDFIEMKEVDAMLTYSVVDPLAAMTVAPKSDFKGLTREFAKARLTDAINDRTLDELFKEKTEKTNFAWKENEQPKELERIGVKVDGLRVTKYDFPPELEKELAARGILVARARGTAEAAVQHSVAGAVYDASDASRGAREILYTESASRQGSNVKYDVHTGMIAKAIEKLADSLQSVFKR